MCHPPLLCLIVVYLKSVPKGNFFLSGYLGISLCLSCWAKGIKQFWLCCCYALIRQLKKRVEMVRRIYFSCLHTRWGALMVSLLKCVRETSVVSIPLWWAPWKHKTRKSACPKDLRFCRGKNRQKLKCARIGANLSEFTPKSESQNGSPRWHCVCQEKLGCCKATALGGWRGRLRPRPCSRARSLMSSLRCPSSWAERRFFMRVGLTSELWHQPKPTSPSPGYPWPLVPPAWWCLHLLVGFCAGGRNLAEIPDACPTPQGSPPCRSKATVLQPRSTMASQRDSLSAAGGDVLLPQERSHQRTFKDSCFSSRKEVNYSTDSPPCFIFYQLLLF